MKWISRILSAFGGLILLALVVLLILSKLPDAGRSHLTMDFNTTPEQLFPWLRDGEKAKQWVSWLEEVKTVGPKSDGVGGKEIWILKDPNMANQLVPVEGECIEYAPPTRLGVKLSSTAFNGIQTYVLSSPSPGKTHLEVDADFNFDGWFPQLMTPVIMPSAKRKMMGDLTKLKSIVETTGPGSL